jgi:hypothetical protein
MFWPSWGFNRIFLQDSTHVKANVEWIDYSGGPALTTSPGGTGLFIFSPTLDVVMIDKNYHLFKIKSSYRQGVSLFSNFHQFAWDLNLMNGRILKERRHSFEAYFGLGVITGAKQLEEYSSRGGAGFSGFNLGSTTYSRKDFVTIGIPLEIKIQWKYIGIGLDANLNLYLPYIGPKLFLKLGNKYLID